MATTTATLSVDRSFIETAITKMEQEKAKLYRGDGAPIYASQEQTERLQSLLQPVLSRFNDLDAHLSEAESEAARLESIAIGADPLSALSADELSKAASLQTLLSDEVATMPLVTLVTRLQAAALSTDKPAKVVWRRLATQRYSRARDLMSRGPSALGGPGRDPVREQNAVGTVARLLEQISVAIADPAALKAGKEAAELRTKSAELRRWATATKNDVTGASLRWRQLHEQWARAQF